MYTAMVSEIELQMSWTKPGPAHGPNFFEKKTMGWAGRVNFAMGAHGPNLA
jgi:hypothetical protein